MSHSRCTAPRTRNACSRWFCLKLENFSRQFHSITQLASSSTHSRFVKKTDVVILIASRNTRAT